MVSRSYYAGAQGYRYGFNGKENDRDVKGDGNQIDYGFRIYDPRLGRFLSLDPLFRTYPDISPFIYAEDEPISNIDMDGLEKVKSTANAISDGVKQYTDETKQQVKGASKLFTSSAPYKNLWNYAKDWGKAVTGDEAALHRFNTQTTRVITKGSMSLANGVTDPAIFFSTTPYRSKYENVKGLTYYGLKTIEFYAIYKISKGLDDDPANGSVNRGPVRLGAEEILPNGQVGKWVEESIAGWSDATIEYQEFVTGVKPGVALKVNEARFDGIRGNTLLDAKADYDQFVDTKTGRFKDFFLNSKKSGAPALLDEARRQITAANGINIEWNFKSQAALKATKSYFESQGLNSGIIYKFNPKSK